MKLWKRVSPLPGGKFLFSSFLGKRIPYTGSISPYVTHLEPGHCIVEMQDRGRLRNHLKCVHALALANLGELTSGLAMSALLPPGARGIPVDIGIEFIKKARGKITAESKCTLPEIGEKTYLDLTADLKNEAGELVARFKAKWQVSKPGA